MLRVMCGRYRPAYHRGSMAWRKGKLRGDAWKMPAEMVSARDVPVCLFLYVCPGEHTGRMSWVSAVCNPPCCAEP